MISDTYSPIWFLVSVIIAGISFMISSAIHSELFMSLSFSFLFAMLFLVILSPKSMWKYNALQTSKSVEGKN